MNIVTNADGDVLYQWVKMSVPSKKSAFYSDSPGYKMLYKNDRGDGVYGFKRAIDSSNPLPSFVELCNEEEVNKLEKGNR